MSNTNGLDLCRHTIIHMLVLLAYSLPEQQTTSQMTTHTRLLPPLVNIANLSNSHKPGIIATPD